MTTNEQLMIAIKQLQDQVNSMQQQIQSTHLYRPQQQSFTPYVRNTCNVYPRDLAPRRPRCRFKLRHSQCITDQYESTPGLTTIPRWYHQSPLLLPYRIRSCDQDPNHAEQPWQFDQNLSNETEHDISNNRIGMKSEQIHRQKVHHQKRRNKEKKRAKRGKKKTIDMNDEETLNELGVSTELISFFYNGEIRRNRLRIEKMERRKAEIEAIPTVKQQEMSDSQRRNKLYGNSNHKKLKQKEIAMDAAFMKSMNKMRAGLGHNEEIVVWPATPLSYCNDGNRTM